MGRLEKTKLDLIRQGFSQAVPQGRLHFAAHSHHPWPDVTEIAHQKYWEDSVRYLDTKWQVIFSTEIPKARENIRSLLGLASADQIIEGTSTFELVSRIISTLDFSTEVRVLTTDSEFYSFERLIRRLSELPNVLVDRVATEPVETFEERLAHKVISAKYDFIYSSLVFYNSGFYADQLLDCLSTVHEETPVVIDIYHAAGAVPLNLHPFADKFFFVGGGYKYLSAGEGACFLSVPRGCQLRPVTTGWLADYNSLQAGMNESVGYPADASRFAGATYDPSGYYRLNAVFEWWQILQLSPEVIHRHVRDLQCYFLDRTESTLPALGRSSVVGFNSRLDWGHFLTWKLPNANSIAEKLRSMDVYVDARDGSLRIGFGYYHTKDEVDRLIGVLREII